jgi:hypothetical protein
MSEVVELEHQMSPITCEPHYYSTGERRRRSLEAKARRGERQAIILLSTPFIEIRLRCDAPTTAPYEMGLALVI